MSARHPSPAATRHLALMRLLLAAPAAAPHLLAGQAVDAGRVTVLAGGARAVGRIQRLAVVDGSALLYTRASVGARSSGRPATHPGAAAASGAVPASASAVVGPLTVLALLLSTVLALAPALAPLPRTFSHDSLSVAAA